MSLAEWNADVMGTIPDWIMAITAVVAAILAYRGLNSWRVQDRQRWDNDLARNLLLALRRYRAAFSYVRSPFAGGDASNLTPEERHNTPQVAQNKYGMIKDYSGRFDELEKRRGEVSALLEKVEILWGQSALPEFANIAKLHVELVVYFRAFFNSMDDGDVEREEMRRVYKRRLHSKRDIQFEVEGDDEDTFSAELDLQFEAVERKVRSRIGRPT